LVLVNSVHFNRRHFSKIHQNYKSTYSVTQQFYL
jgi:hypothetical protein